MAPSPKVAKHMSQLLLSTGITLHLPSEAGESATVLFRQFLVCPLRLDRCVGRGGGEGARVLQRLHFLMYCTRTGECSTSSFHQGNENQQIIKCEDKTAIKKVLHPITSHISPIFKIPWNEMPSKADFLLPYTSAKMCFLSLKGKEHLLGGGKEM